MQVYLKAHDQERPKESYHGTYPDIGWHQRLLTRNGSQSSVSGGQISSPTTIMVVQRGSGVNACDWDDRNCQASIMRCGPVLRLVSLCKWHAAHWPRHAWQTCMSENSARTFNLARLCREVMTGVGGSVHANEPPCVSVYMTVCNACGSAVCVYMCVCMCV